MSAGRSGLGVAFACLRFVNAVCISAGFVDCSWRWMRESRWGRGGSMACRREITWGRCERGSLLETMYVHIFVWFVLFCYI